MILRHATSLRGALKGVGPEIKTFLGPKKSRFSGPTPSNASKYKYKRHKNNRYIGSFMYQSAVV
jgi:hypothetical protein